LDFEFAIFDEFVFNCFDLQRRSSVKGRMAETVWEVFRE
jgi:hypothetical protein